MKNSHKVFKELFFKITAKLLIIIFATITFIFGIHNDIFSSYDKHSTDSEPLYDWFDIEDILRFPVDQFKLNVNGSHLSNEIDLKDLLPLKDSIRKITIILDRTASLSSQNYDNYKKSLCKKLEKDLNDRIHDFDKFKNLKLEELFLITALHCLEKDSKNYKKTYLEVLFYLGDNDLQKTKKEKIFYKYIYDDEVDSKEFKNVYQKLIKNIDSLNKNKEISISKDRKTNFHSVAAILQKSKFLGENTDVRYDHSNLILLSDFIHESNYKNSKSFHEVSEKLQELNKLVKQVNIISFNATEDSLIRISDETKRIFSKTFNNVHYYEFEDYLKNQVSSKDQISRMFCSTIDNKKPIILYHLFNSESYKYDFTGDITFKNDNSQKNKSLILSFGKRTKPRNFIEKYNYLEIFNDEDNYFNKIYAYNIAEIHNNKRYKLSFTTDDTKSKNNFIELNSPLVTSIVRKPLLLKPVLPETACIYLICLYFLGTLIILLMGIYFFFSFKKYYSKPLSGKSMLIVFLILVPYILSVYPFTLSCISIKILIGELNSVILILTTIIIFLLILFSYSLQKMKVKIFIKKKKKAKKKILTTIEHNEEE